MASGTLAKRKSAAANRAAATRRRNEATQAINEVGKLPPLRAKKFYERCSESLLYFLEKAFPQSTGQKPFSEAQKNAIQNLQDAILSGGSMLCQALPRGFAKTAIVTRAALWAVIFGHAKYVVVYSALSKLATSMVKGIKTELRRNKQLHKLIPGVAACIKHLGDSSQKCRSQTVNGVHTSPIWSADVIGLPNIPDFVGSGAIIESKAIDSGRGASETKDNLSVDRPDLILIDDPQTNVSARNPDSVRNTIGSIEASIMGAGHDSGTTVVINCTVIEEDDVSEHYLSHPDWVRIRYKMMETMPMRMDLWEKYAEIMRDFSESNVASEHIAREKAMHFYQSHRTDMDQGAKATWQWCYAWKKPSLCEISAVQHAMNLYFKRGREYFEKECQNNPKFQLREKSRLKWTDVSAKRIKLPADVCPDGTAFITGHCDVHESVLCYVLIAWSRTFSGHVLRWKIWPEQEDYQFRFKAAKRRIVDAAPEGSDIDAAIYYGLTQVFDDVFNDEYFDESGTIMDVNAFGVDAGFKGTVIRQAIRDSPYRSLLFPMHSDAISAKKTPMSEYQRRDGEKIGEEWIYKRPAKQLMRQFTPDANHWKTWMTDGWRFPVGHRHALTIHDQSTAEVKMFCQQCVAEKPTPVTVGTRTVDEWTLPSDLPDNHAGDNVYNAAVLASFRGLNRSPAAKPVKTKRYRKSKVRF